MHTIGGSVPIGIVGYGIYINEVRIVRFAERSSYSVGQWVNHSNCYRLDLKDYLEVTCDIEDATDHRNKLRIGTCCQFIGYALHLPRINDLSQCEIRDMLCSARSRDSFEFYLHVASFSLSLDGNSSLRHL